MGTNTATLIGATGLIGSHLLQLLKEDKSFETIRLLVRRPYQENDKRVEVKLIDFEDAESFKLGIENSDVVFCAIGTTQKKVKGDKTAYYKIDYDIPTNAAKFCKETGCKSFVLVSSVGADSKSKNFYLRIKGEVEDAIRNLSLDSVHIMRPSVLIGKRNEFRFGEGAAKAIMKAVSLFLAGGMRKYKPIEGRDVAAAMLQAAKQNKKGFFIYEYDSMRTGLGD